MEELPAQSHKAKEQRDIQPVVRNPGRIRKPPFGRRLLDTFVLGDLKTTINNMIWDTFFPNMRENFQDSLHNGVESLFGGVSSGYRSGRRGGYYAHNSQISKHNPDRALGGRGGPAERISKDERNRQETSSVELDSRVEAGQVLEALNQIIDQYEVATLADFYKLAKITPEHTDYKWGWEDLGGAHVVHSRGVYYLDLPPVIALR